MQADRPMLLPLDAREQAGTVEEGVRGIQMRTAHRIVPGIDFQRDRERLPARCSAPGMLVELGQRDGCTAIIGGLDADDVTGEVADQITAGRPGGHGQHHTRRIRLIDCALDLEQVRVRLRHPHLITDAMGLHASISG